MLGGRATLGIFRRAIAPPRTEREELIDSFEHSEQDFARSFADIRHINRFLGGTAVVRRELAPLLPKGNATLLDLGTGSADIPTSLVRWARGRGCDLSVVGLDANAKVLRYAQEETKDEPAVRLILGGARHLPFPDASFDFVVSSLTFHHFDDALVTDTLREMHRVARRAVIVNDLRRGHLPAALIWIVTRATGMHRLTRHDAPLSVMRSRTPQEYRELVRDYPSARVKSHPFWRAAITSPIEPQETH